MARSMGKFLALMLVFAVWALCPAGQQAWGQEKTLRFQVNYPGTSYGGDTMRYFAQRVDANSGGRLKVQLFYAGQILKSAEAFGALQKGMIDGMYSALIYYGGVVKEANWEWLPFMWETPEQVIELYTKHGLLDLMRQALAQHKVRYLAPIPMGTLGFLTKFDVKTISDFQGHKIRGMGTQAKIIQALGGTPVSLSPAEQYTSLQRGTIEGTIYPWYTISTYKFYEVIDYVITPGVYSPCVIDMVLNQEVYDSLAPELQKAVDDAALQTMEWAASQNKIWDEKGLAETMQHKVKVVKIPEAEFARFREATKALRREVSARSELSAKAVAIVEKYMNEK